MGDRGWSALPEPVRARLAEITSAALGELSPSDVPPPLRRLARFTPSKRARLAGRQLLAELRRSAAFRASVWAWWEEHRGCEPTGAMDDQVTAAAEAVLTGAPDTDERLAAVAERVDAKMLRAERDAALARVDKLTAELDRLRAELADARKDTWNDRAALERELDRLRRRVREQGMRARAAEDRARAAERELAELRATTAEELTALRAERDRARERARAERVRASRAGEEAEGARQAAHLARRGDEVRLDLLLETLVGAAEGVRRELGLAAATDQAGSAGFKPADLVGKAESTSAPRPGASVITEVAELDRLLGLPQVHLIVDGYNVSKTGYPELTLFEQRGRLISALGVLAARTGAEVTVVFDGAAVAAAPPRQPRGVRVLFSAPGELADDLIRRLVDAEPPGRPLVVASSDRAVADSVRRRGAWPLDSSVLLTVLSRV